MELNFSKKTRKIVASLLAVAILLGVLPVSGLTGNSSGAEGNNGSANTIFVKSDHQPVLFDSNGNVKSVLTKKDGTENVYTATPENGDKIGVFKDKGFGTGKSIVFFKSNEWNAPCVYLWQGEVNNGGFTDTKMTKLSDGIYYSVYPSNTYKQAVFNNGNNNEKTGDLSLVDFGVYVHNSDGSISNESSAEYFNCVDYKESNNVYEFTADSNTWKEANVNKPTPNVTISGNGKDEVKVIEKGAGKDVSYTYYSNQKVVANASNVTGFTASKVEYSNNVYSVTYTSNEYNFISYEFTSGTVSFEELDALTVTGEWKVYDGDKEISDDIVVRDGKENVTAKYTVTSAEYQGNQISEKDLTNLTIALRFNGNDYTNGSVIAKENLKAENNTLSGTATYNEQTVSLVEYKFNCVESKGVDLTTNSKGTIIVEKNGESHIYSSPDEAVLEIEKVGEASDYAVSSKNKVIKVTQDEENKNIFTIKGISGLGEDTAELEASYVVYGKTITKSYTLHYKNKIAFTGMKYTTKDESDGTYKTYPFVKEGTTVRAQFSFNVSEQQLIDKIECVSAPDGVDKDALTNTKTDKGIWYKDITKPGTYEFVIYDKCGNTLKETITPENLKIDDKKPTVNRITFKSVETGSDKVLKFLTFGIYSKNEIEVTVNVEDEGLYSSGISEIELYNGKKEIKSTAVDYANGNATFTLEKIDDIYNLEIKAIDNVGHDSEVVGVSDISVFEEVEKDQYVQHEVSKNSEGKFEIVSTGKAAYVEEPSFTPDKTSDNNDNNDYYSCDGCFSFEVKDDLSGIKSVKAYLDGNEVQLVRTDEKSEKTATFDEAYFDKEAEGIKSTVKSASFKYTATELKDGKHTFYARVENNSGIVTESADKRIFIDKTVPEVKKFRFEDGLNADDKILSFLTFGIYHNDKIKVTVSATDETVNGVATGVKAITLYNGAKEIETKDNLKNGEATFILNCDSKSYKLSATATDNVGNISKYWTFNGVDVISFETGRNFDNISSYDKAPTWDNFEVVATNKKPEVKINDDDITPLENTYKYTDTNDNNKMYFSSGANIKFTVEDKISGIKNVEVYLDGKDKSGTRLDVTTESKNDPASYDQLKDKTKSDTFYFSTGALSEGEHTIYIYAQNNSGNNLNGGYVSKTFYVDKTPSEITGFTFSANKSVPNKLLSFLTFGIYRNDSINVEVTASDNASGVGSIMLYGDGEPKTVNIKNGDNSAVFTLKKSATAYKIYASTTDNVGNANGYYTFKTENYGNEYRKDNETFNDKNLIYRDEEDEVKNYLTEIVSSDQKPVIKDFKLSATNGLDAVNLNGNNWYSSDVNTNFTVDGGLSGINSVKLFVDTYEENAKINEFPQDNNNGADKEISMVTSNESDSNNSTGSSSAVFGHLNDSYFTAPARKGKITEAEFIYLTNPKRELSEGKHTITIFVRSNNYEFSYVQKTFYVDRSTPKVTKFEFSPTVTNNSNNEPVENKNAYGYYVNQQTKVTVTADDETDVKPVSGVKEIFYKAVDFNGKTILNESKSVNSNNSISFDVEPNFKGYIYAYAVDIVYNGSEDAKYSGKVAVKAESHPDGLVVENGEMHAESSGITATLPNSSYSANGNSLYSGDITIPVTVTDSYSGIKQIEYSVKSNYDTQNNQSQTVDIANSVSGSSVGGWSFDEKDNNLVTQMSRNITVKNNSNDIVLTVKLTDRAGNETKIEKKFSIDKTKPVIDVKYDNNEHTTYGGNDYYKADRTATVTVTERNFDESLVEAAIMRNGGRYTTIGGWTHNNNTADPDKSTHVAKIVYNTDGDFTFDIAVKDKAMNSADKFTQQKFTVDKTAPVIDVSFDNNSAKNGNYYKADRTATIKITEHNFNSGSQYVNIPVTAEGTTAPSVVGWSGSGDDHNATVSFNKDGKYSFTVDYTDLAGNKAVQKKVDSFYIDKTAPEVEITGVADHQAYNGTVAPVVTYRDDNFTDDHDFRFTKIDINGKSDDTSKFDYDTGGNGVTEFIYKYRDFAEVLENDGIYNFTVELSDKAGNSTSKSVTFSVNRFGSTFRTTDEPTEKLINNGYTNAEQDIVVEEINVTPLTKHSVTLAKSGGNSTELVENTDYTFTSSNNGNEWCKSVYTVNKKNFSDEAAYTVTIMSVDKAKNTNNNRMADSSLSTEQKNKRECAISFVVDKTSPLVSITGIKDNELYKEASKKVKIVCEDDNLDKSKLVVTLDNKKLAEGEDYTIVDDRDGSIAGMLTAEIVLKAETGGIKENLKVTIGDLAGNTGEKSVDNFILSANIFQRFFANPVLVICTFAGLALVIAAVIFFVVKKRKKAE
ncbi:MAG: starch-binding protein [Ruminococcus sp.]|nr:Ig-like domain-containing protein [Ruminococcus sp.]MBS6810343.1 starch-binding protein [Ruminococcus sp.]